MVRVAGQTPDPRKDSTLVYEPSGHRLWLFGGRIQGKETNELWSFDIARQQWSQVTVSGGPPGRWGHVAIYDAKRRQMVVFSGQSSSGFFNDTWLFDTAGQQWRQVATEGPKPSARYGSCAGYNAERDVMYISHGFTDTGRFDDTWVLNLATNQWGDDSPMTTRPIKRCLHRCGYDPLSKGFYLFGGQSNEVPILGDLWRFDPLTRIWVEVTPAGEKPLPRFFSALAVQESPSQVLLFGGQTSEGRARDLWAYTVASGWQALQVQGTAPEARSNHAAALDTVNHVLYIFGGVGASELGDLWRLKV